MLKNFFFDFKFFRFIQSNLFVDYIIKKIIEIFLKNTLIYSSLFFGEKFIIEYLTKKVFYYYIYTLINYFSLYNFNLNYLFLNLIFFFFFFLGIINLIFFIFI